MNIENSVLRFLAGLGITIVGFAVLAGFVALFVGAVTFSTLIADGSINFQWYHGVVMVTGFGSFAIFILSLTVYLAINLGDDLFNNK